MLCVFLCITPIANRHLHRSLFRMLSGILRLLFRHLMPSFVNCPARLRVVLFLGLRCRQITAPPSSLHVRTFVTACFHSSLCHVFAQGHKRRRSARHTLNAGVTKAGQPHANRIPLLYPCYTLTPLCVCLLQDDFIIRSFFVSDTIRNFLTPRGACLKSFAELGGSTAFGLSEETVKMAECVETA